MVEVIINPETCNDGEDLSVVDWCNPGQDKFKREHDMDNCIPILLYHDIESERCPNEKVHLATKDTVVEAERFHSQMEYLWFSGYKTLTLNEYFNLREKKKSIPSKSVIITFDDGHYSNFEVALPILQKFGFRAVFFVIANRIDTKYHLSRQQLNQMVGMFMEIGSHGLTHQYLPNLTSRLIKTEFIKSKQILEHVIGKNIDYFCFPGGHYNRKVIKLLKNSEYKGACTCHIGMNNFEIDPYLLKRIEVRKNVKIKDFKHIFNYGNLFRYQLIDQLKGAVKKVVGLNNYSRVRSRFYRYYKLKR